MYKNPKFKGWVEEDKSRKDKKERLARYEGEEGMVSKIRLLMKRESSKSTFSEKCALSITLDELKYLKNRSSCNEK